MPVTGRSMRGSEAFKSHVVRPTAGRRHACVTARTDGVYWRLMSSGVGGCGVTLREIVARVNEWAAWRLSLETSVIGYPSQSAEARAASGVGRSVPCALVPDIPLNPRAVEVDRCVRDMPDEMRGLVMAKHLTPGSDVDKAREYCRIAGVSMATYYSREKEAYWFIGGWLRRDR